jgi:predicted XRE-type DNA-binding protein
MDAISDIPRRLYRFRTRHVAHRPGHTSRGTARHAYRTLLDWEDLERERHAAGVSPEEIEAGARRLLAQARGHQLAETRKQLALGQKQIAAAMGVSVARVSQIEHGEVTSFEVIARYVEALGGRLDLVADFGDRTVRLPVSDTPTAA